jgi:hypothetical protein
MPAEDVEDLPAQGLLRLFEFLLQQPIAVDIAPAFSWATKFHRWQDSV